MSAALKLPPQASENFVPVICSCCNKPYRLQREGALQADVLAECPHCYAVEWITLGACV